MKGAKRICIYPKDIMRVTGRSERYSRKLLEKIKKRHAKEPHQFVTLEEFCNFAGLKPELVEPFLED